MLVPLLRGRRSPSPWSTPILLRGQRPPSLRPARSFPVADGPPAPWPARSLLAAACPSSMDGLHRLSELVEVVPFILDLQLQVTNDATKRKRIAAGACVRARACFRDSFLVDTGGGAHDTGTAVHDQ
nr:uncharacterized protein LOC120968401 isoform X2 [Aegilops tauschii subsp. strangulata]